MTYPLPINFGPLNPSVSAANINNWSSLINTIWLLLAGVPVMPTARVATVGTETFTVAAGAVTTINGTTIDGVSVSATGALNGLGDYVLIKDAPATTGVGTVNSTQPANGLYQVSVVATNITLVRATQMSSSGAATTPAGMIVAVMAGTTNGGLGWSVTSPSSAAAIAFGPAWVTPNPIGSQTVTNLRVTKRISTVVSATSNTIAINTDLCDIFKITALAVPVTTWTITGTPQHGDTFELEIVDNGTSQSLEGWAAWVKANGVTSLPQFTSGGKKITLKLKYDADVPSWVCLAADLKGY